MQLPTTIPTNIKVDTQFHFEWKPVNHSIEDIANTVNGGATLSILTDGMVQIARIDVLDTSGRFEPEHVMKATDAHMVQPLEHHGASNPTTHYIQYVYRLYYVLDSLVTRKKATDIEEDLIVSLIDTCEDIDINGGQVNGVTKSHDFRITNVNDIIVNEKNVNAIDIEEIKKKQKLEKEFEKIANEARVNSINNPVSDLEAVDMASWLAKREIEPADDKEWKRIATGLWNSIADETITLHILRVLDRHRHDDDHYKSFKPKGLFDGRKASIGSFIEFAKLNGYKRTFVNRFAPIGEVKEEITTETIEINQYINEGMREPIVNLLKPDGIKSILLDSPTGSGKTTATVSAIKKWVTAKPDRYVYIANPVQSLSDQTATTKELGRPLMGSASAKVILTENQENLHLNVVVGTYDKAEYFMDTLKNVKNAEVVVIIDEAHKEVSDYNFRKRAIKRAFDLREHPQVVKFIGLSGTPQEIDKSLYNKMIVFKQKNAKPIFNNLHVLTYNNAREFSAVIPEVILKERKEGRRVKAFINNKLVITEIAGILRNKGVNVEVIVSESGEKKSATYNHLIEHESFPEGIEVILATNVIADGINILNDDENYSVIIGPHYNKSPIFNLSLVKQMTNRLRNPYENLIIPLFIPKRFPSERAKTQTLYNIEARYQTLLKEATKTANELKEKFGDKLHLYKPSILEKANGLPHVNSHYEEPNGPGTKYDVAYFEKAVKLIRQYDGIPLANPSHAEIHMMNHAKHIVNQMFTVDRRTLRKTASQDAEQYYSYFPYAFMRGLEEILKIEVQKDTCENYIKGIETNVSNEIRAHLAENEELKKESEKAKEKHLTKVLTEDVYTELKHHYFKSGRRYMSNNELWQGMNKLMSNNHVRILKSVLPLVAHGHALNIIQSVTRKSDNYNFVKGLRSYDTYMGFGRVNEETKTEEVLRLIETGLRNADYTHKVDEQHLTNKQLEHILVNVAMDSRHTMKEVTAVFEEFYVFDKGNVKVKVGGKRKNYRTKYNIRPINLEDLGTKYNINAADMERIYKRYKADIEEGYEV